MINCTFENEHTASLRHVTVDAIVVSDNKILLVKRASHLTNPNKYALPGGFLDRDETTEDAVRREIKEETGYDVKSVKLFRTNDTPNRKGEDRQNVDFVFIVEVGGKTSKSDNEIQKIAWFDLGKLPKPDDFAFDHYENIELYKKHKNEQKT